MRGIPLFRPLVRTLPFHRMAVRWGWILGLVVIPSVGFAQFGNVPNAQTDLFRPAPRILQQQLKRAESAIAEGDYRLAVELLGAVLTGQSQDPDLAEIRQDYFVRDLENPQHRTSIKARALKLLGDLPAEGRQWFELKFGTEAAQLVRKAVADRDIAQLYDVTRKYFHTQAGYDAVLLVGRWQLDQGHPLAAALSLKRLYDVPHARGTYEPTLSLLLATSWFRAGMPETAADVIRDLKANYGQRKIVLGGRAVPWYSSDSDTLAWLEKNLGGAEVELHLREQQWVVFRGNPQRNGLMEGGAPLMHYRWRVATVLDPSDADLVAAQRMSYESEGRVVIPMFQPLAVGDLIVMRTPERIFGVSLTTGKRIWDYPWFQEALEGADEKDYVAYGNRAKRMEQLRERLWEDAAYGQLASDGERVYLLDGMDYTSTGGTANRQVMMFPQAQQGQVTQARGTNQLVACSIAEEGKLQWIVGGVSGEDEPELAGAFFLGAPLPLMGQLFVLAEMSGEIRLLALDAANGSLEWFQQVAHVAELTIDRDPHRRLAGATPSFDDGILVCPTSAGACVAIDLATRSLLWGYQYPAMRPSTNRFRTRTSFPDVGDRWIDGTAVLADGCVLLTPVESTQLHCLDLISGKQRWEPIDRGGMLFIGGVYDGLIFLVGTDRCRAIQLQNGLPAWEDDLELGSSRPSGRGFLTGRYYFLPTTSSEILKIDIQTGDVVQTIPTDQPLGNLISYRDQIISQNVDWLACYYQAEPLRQLVEQRLQANPQDVWALLRKAEIELHDGEREQALATLRLTYRLAPEDQLAKDLLIHTLMDALRSDFSKYHAMADELKQLIDQPGERLEYLRLVLDGAIDLEDWNSALGSLRELIASAERVQDSVSLGELNSILRIDSSFRVRFDRWIAARVAEFHRRADARHRGLLQADLSQRLESAGSDISALRRVVDLYGSLPGADEARLRLAQAIFTEGESLTEAELVLSDLVDRRSSAPLDIRARALALHVEILERAEQPHEAAIAALRLLKMAPQERIAGESVTDWAGRKLAELAKADAVTKAWPTGEVTIEKAQETSRSSSYTYYFTTDSAVGAPVEGTRAAYDVGRREIRLIDPLGETRAEYNVGTYFHISGPWPYHVSQRGHMVLANLGFTVVMLNGLQAGQRSDDLLWRADTGAALRSNQRTYRQTRTMTLQGEWGGPRYRAVDQQTQTPLGNTAVFLSHAAIYQNLREIICSDPLTGEMLWSRGGFDPGCELFGDDEVTFVIPPDGEEAVVLRTRDGHQLGRRSVPPLTQRWATWGSQLLSCAKSDKGFHIELRDLADDSVVWERDVASGALMTRVEHDELAIVTRDGRLTVLDLASGAEVVSHQGDQVHPQLDQLYVMRSSQDYLVILSGETPAQGSLSFRTPIPVRCPLISGFVYALDRATGNAKWVKPATIAGYAIPLDQPAESPVLLMLRQTSDSSRIRNPAPSSQSTVMCLDRRFGNVLVPETPVKSATNFDMLIEPAKQRVQVSVRGVRIALTFTDKAVQEAREPVQMELKATLKVSDAIEGVGKIAEELFKGLGGKPAKQEEKNQTPPDNRPPDR